MATDERIRSGTLDLLMISLGLSSETVARRARVSRPTVSQWRNGRTQISIDDDVVARAIAWEHVDKFHTPWLYLKPTEALAIVLDRIPELWERWDHQDDAA